MNMPMIKKYTSIKDFKAFFYFALVGGFGTLLNTAILYLLSQRGGMNYLFASAIATETAIISNFIGNNYITFRDKNTESRILGKFLSFQLISLVSLAGTIFFLWLFVTLFGKNLLLVWNVLAIVIMFVANFILNSAFTWNNNTRNKDRSGKAHDAKGILILFLFYLLIQSSHLVKAEPLNTSANITITNQTINNTITNQAINATVNDTINTTINMTINTTAINQTINQTINITINDTGNITINNQTINITVTNQTINITTTNQTINQTINITITNQTINQTINITVTNQTINNTITNETINQTINITTTNQTINQTINITGNQTVNTPNASSSIIGKGVNLKILSDANGTRTYYMREDNNATFFVLFNSPNDVAWFVDGVEQGTTNSDNATFFFNPGILWIPRAPDYSNKAVSTITAITPNGTVSWNVEVENVINPFFSSINDSADILGSPDTKVHVFTNDDLVKFTGVNVTIVSSGGSLVFQLGKQFSSANETDWSVYIPSTAPGDNYLTTITGFNNVTNATLTYDIGTSRSHYQTIPAGNSGGNNDGNSGGGGGGNSGGGGGGGSGAPITPELVYITFGKDVVATNQTQTITLDAENFGGGIQEVNVTLVTPDRYERELQLELVSGTQEYGTWSVTFGNFTHGQYNVSSVTLFSDTQISPTDISVENRSFYYTDLSGAGAANVNLSLVYSILDSDNVKNGTVVTLTLDAQDSDGIRSADAYIQNIVGGNISSEDTFMIPLHLKGGNGDYGTWKGEFMASRPDSTYEVMNITLNNSESSRIYQITGRSVYVMPIPNNYSQVSSGSRGLSQNSILGITGAIIMSPFSKDDRNIILKDPFTPTIIGFLLMIILSVVILSITKTNGNRQDKHKHND